MSTPSQADGLKIKPATRKRNLSQLTHSSRISRNEIDKERGWVPQRLIPPVDKWHQQVGNIMAPGSKIAPSQRNKNCGDFNYRKNLDYLFTSNLQPELSENTEDMHSTGLKDEKKDEIDFKSNYKEKCWSQVAIQVMNVVVGKAWEFCKNSAAIFRGFQAGGGTKYKLKYTEDSEYYFEACDDTTLDSKEDTDDLVLKSLPKEWSQTHQTSTSNNSNKIQLECISSRPSKRYHLSNTNKDYLDKNWVFVSTDASTPTKTNVSTTRAKLPPTNLPRYSPAKARSFCHNTTTRSTLGASTFTGSNFRSCRSQVSHAGSSTLSSMYRASFASSRSSENHISCFMTPQSSPIRKKNHAELSESPDALESRRQAHRWALMLKKDEKRQNESIERLDAQLKVMIREGKEALSSKIEVSFDDNNEPL